MFSDYFSKKSLDLTRALKSNLKKQGVKSPGKKKDVVLFQHFYDFLGEHIPNQFSLATGKVRNKKHLLNRSCDLIVYNKWCEKYLDLTGGYILSDSMYAFMSIEKDVAKSNLQTHANMTRALKSLYATEKEVGDALIPVYSILFAYTSSKEPEELIEFSAQINSDKEIAPNQTIDMIVILDKAIIIRDYENSGELKSIITGNDTLMWFYILLMEYLDRDGSLQLDLRDYIKQNENY